RGLHPRWRNREYSDLYSYDLTTGKLDEITKNQKYLAVDYQPGTNRYLAVQAGEDGQTSLVTCRAQDNTADTVFQNNDAYLSDPRWLDSSGDTILFTRRAQGKTALCLYDAGTREMRTLIGPVNATISRPVVSPRGIFYSSSSTGMDNIHFFDFST